MFHSPLHVPYPLTRWSVVSHCTNEETGAPRECGTTVPGSTSEVGIQLHRQLQSLLQYTVPACQPAASGTWRWFVMTAHHGRITLEALSGMF